MATLVYKYGLRPPTGNADLARRHLRAAHRYRNILTEIERGRRDAIRLAEKSFPLLADMDAELAELDATCRRLSVEAKAARSAKRTRSLAPELRLQLKDARASLKTTKAVRRAYRKDHVMPALQVERDRVNNLAADLRRNTRQNRKALTGELLYHGTYTMVEDADNAARKAPLWDGLVPGNPRFLRWEGEGILSAQICKGADPADALSGNHTQFRISPTEHGRHLVYKLLRLRQESVERKPVWVDWPLKLHRPIPSDAKIMRVSVHCKVVAGDMGPREEWHCTLTLRLPDAVRRNDGPSVAIDVGWRMLPDGSLRVAYWRGEDGRHGQLVLTSRQIDGLTKADSIRSIRDRNLDTLKKQMNDCVCDARLPEHLAKECVTVAQWKSPKRFHRLARSFAQLDHPGFGDMTALLAAWAKRDHHLAGYECGQRRGATRNRRDLYRRFAAWLAKSYDVVVLEKFDKRVFTRTALPEDGAGTEGINLHHAQRLACTSELCSVLKSKFGQLGRWIEVPCEGTTTDCAADPNCVGKLAGDAASGIVQSCSAGHEWDQDDNACKNLLRRNRERPSDAENCVGARDGNPPETESRWSRAKRMRAEKQERAATARNNVSNAV